VILPLTLFEYTRFPRLLLIQYTLGHQVTPATDGDMALVDDAKVESNEAVLSISDADVGLSADEIQLRGQGHKGELPRQFSALSLLAIAFSITNSWIGYSASFITPLFAGGGPAVFWGLLVAGVACSLIS
jgi:hypothetical protein